ncbi:MAG TPA: DUF4333 domain-containing protein [Acidimicrobiales bacterium]|nr:DUF4333 domain-containing protein [Acidimicrobiales bacterium]
MRSRARSAIALAVAAGAGGILSSCDVGPSHTLNPKSVQSQIAKQLSSRYPVSGVLVVCPGKIPDQVGFKFSCTVSFNGGTVRLDGEVTSSKGSYNIRPEEAIISTAQAATTLESDISAQVHATTKVDCGPVSVKVVPVGGQFSCQATITGQGTRRVTVTVEDLDGHFRYSVAPPSSSS